MDYKKNYNTKLKEVIAFANADGGEIYVGVNNCGFKAPLLKNFMRGV